MLQSRRLEEGCWLAPGAPRKEPVSGWTLAARAEWLSNAVRKVLDIVGFHRRWDWVLRTGVVELEVIFLEVGMAEIALYLC